MYSPPLKPRPLPLPLDDPLSVVLIPGRFVLLGFTLDNKMTRIFNKLTLQQNQTIQLSKGVLINLVVSGKCTLICLPLNKESSMVTAFSTLSLSANSIYANLAASYTTVSTQRSFGPDRNLSSNPGPIVKLSSWAKNLTLCSALHKKYECEKLRN